jgi:hypothetical protein
MIMQRFPHDSILGEEFGAANGSKTRYRWGMDPFDGMIVQCQPDGTTTLSGPVRDQAALHGLLRKVRKLGMPLLSVIRVQT